MTNELDNLKNAWKTVSEVEQSKDYSADELQKIVKRKSNSELLKIRKKFIFEWIATIMLSIFIVLFVRFFNESDTTYAILFVLLVAGISLIPSIKIMRFIKTSNDSLKDFLIEYLASFDNLMKQYIKMAAFLLPVTIVGGILLGTHASMPESEWNTFFGFRTVSIIALIVLILSVGSYWLQKRYFNWVYGKNLKRLKACLAELELVEE